MFDDPGKKLKALEDELWEADPEAKGDPSDFEEEEYPEEFDDSSAVLAGRERRPGLRTLVLLMVLAGAVLAARWLGWL